MSFKYGADSLHRPSECSISSTLASIGGGALTGLLSKSGSGSGGATQTTITRPFAEQIPFITSGFQRAEDLFQGGPQQFFPGQTLAPQSPFTQQSQDLALQAASGGFGLGGVQSQLEGALNFGFGSALNPAADPNVQNQVRFATDEILRSLGQTQQGVGDVARLVGQSGSSRQGVANALASESAQRQIGATTADILGTARGQGISAFQSALGSLPFAGQLAQTQALLPAQITGAVGAQDEARRQAEINAERERFGFGQQAPGSALDDFIRRTTGNFGSTSTTTGSGAGVSSFNQVLGGLTGAAGLAGSVMGIPGIGALGSLFGGGGGGSGFVNNLPSFSQPQLFGGQGFPSF